MFSLGSQIEKPLSSFDFWHHASGNDPMISAFMIAGCLGSGKDKGDLVGKKYKK